MPTPVERRITGIQLTPQGRPTPYVPVVLFRYAPGAVDVTLDFQDGFSPVAVARAQMYEGLRRLARNLTDDLRVEPVADPVPGVTVALLHGTGEWLPFRFSHRQVERFLEATVAADAPYLLSEAEMARAGS